MGNQYSYPEAKANQTKLKSQVESVASHMQNLQGVITNFMSAEEFNGETGRQMKAFMGEVVMGAMEASNLLIENVERQYETMVNRFQGIDGADDAIIYDSRLDSAIHENDAYAKTLLNKANEMNRLIQQANGLGVSAKPYNTGEVGQYQNIANTKIQELREKLTSEGNKADEASSLDQFINGVRQFVSYLGSCQPSTYNSGALAGEPFYQNDYMPKAIEFTKNKPYDYFTPLDPKNMTTIEKVAIATKMNESYHKAKAGDKEAEVELEKFISLSLEYAAIGSTVEEKNINVRMRAFEYESLMRQAAIAKSNGAFGAYHEGESYENLQPLLESAQDDADIATIFGALGSTTKGYPESQVIDKSLTSGLSIHVNIDFRNPDNNDKDKSRVRVKFSTDLYAQGYTNTNIGGEEADIALFSEKPGENNALAGDLQSEANELRKQAEAEMNPFVMGLTFGVSLLTSLSTSYIPGAGSMIESGLKNGKHINAMLSMYKDGIKDIEEQHNSGSGKIQEAEKCETQSKIADLENTGGNLVYSEANRSGLIVIPDKELLNRMEMQYVDETSRMDPSDRARGMKPAPPNVKAISDLKDGTMKFLGRQNEMLGRYQNQIEAERIGKTVNDKFVSFTKEDIQQNVTTYGNPYGSTDEYDSTGNLKITAQKAREWIEANGGRKSW